MNEVFFQDLESIKRDAEQWEAFTSKVNTAVIAGPGSGKTRVLALKAVSLMMAEIKKPAGLACISYSRETVRELRKRLRSYGFVPSSHDFIGTVHSFSLLNVIEPFAGLFPQYQVKYPIKIIPDDVEHQIYNGILSKFKLKPKEMSLAQINRHRNLNIQGMSGVPYSPDTLVQAVSDEFERRIHATEYIDFAGIIGTAAIMIKEQPFVRRALQCRFPWLLVDEYQDLGKALHEMVLELVFNADLKLFVVGDMNQSIYGFNGGYPDFLEELTKYADIRPIYLTSNYRSTQHIIEASNATLPPGPFAVSYLAKLRLGEPANFSFITCQAEMEEQYQVVATKVVPKLIANGIPRNEIGILTSSNGQVAAMATELQLRGIGFYIAKWDFENSAVVVWLQDCALWCMEPEKQSFDELFYWWHRLLIGHCDPRQNWEIIRLKMLFRGVLEKSNFYGLLRDWLNSMVSELKLPETLHNSEMYPNEVDNLARLLQEATTKNLKDASIERFSRLGSPDNQVTISTRHSSKGLEFEAVIMLGMEEEHFPSYYDLKSPDLIKEAQRLCYVCVSRAKSNCTLIRSEGFTLDGRFGPWLKKFPPSRFWLALHNKFGTPTNTFTDKTFH